MYIFILLIFFSLVLKSYHLLSVLISLEFFGLFIFFLFSMIYLKMLVGTNVLVAILMSMGCESAVGLVLFVSISRFYSKDYFLGTGSFSF